MIVKEVTFGALGGGLSAAIASAVTRSPPEKGSTLVEFHRYSKRSQRIDHQPILLMARRWADRLNALRPQLPLLTTPAPQDLSKNLCFALISSTAYATLTTGFCFDCN